MAQVAVCSQISKKHINSVWAELTVVKVSDIFCLLNIRTSVLFSKADIRVLQRIILSFRINFLSNIFWLTGYQIWKFAGYVTEPTDKRLFSVSVQ